MPVSLLPADAVRIVGSQDVVARDLYSAGSRVVLNRGTVGGLQVDLRFYIRRPPAPLPDRNGLRAASTAGWLRIVAANETTAIGMVEYACDGVTPGDLLQPYVDPVLPPDVDRTDVSGEPDFSATGRVLFGDNERTTGGAGDLLLVGVNQLNGAQPGERLAVYRDVQVPGVPLASVGEAVVIVPYGDIALVRLTLARDAIRTGDLVVPRRQP